ncbi:hypothetical protein [Variovorax gossypii]
MIRVDAVWLATEPIDIRAGTETALARVVKVFGAPKMLDQTKCQAGSSQTSRYLLHFPDVTSSGRYAVIYSTPGSQTNSMSIVDLNGDSWEARTVVADFDNEWTVIGGAISTL